MTWARCDDSPFYRKDFADSPLHMAFLDPVGLVLVQTLPKKMGLLKKEVIVVRNRIYREPDPDELNRVLDEPEAYLMQSWLNHVLKVQKSGKAWVRELLGNLDVDVVERDRLLDALYEYVATYTSRLRYGMNSEVIWAQPRPEAVREALQEFGILPSCA